MSKGSNEAIFNEELTDDLHQYLLVEDGLKKEQLRDKIVRQVMPYVKKIAYGLARRSTDPVEDLIQVGNIGLMKAVEKFDPLAGTSFKTYATYLITGEIRHYLRDKSAMIKAPRQVYELYYRMNMIVQKLSDDLGRSPTDLEIAEELQCPVDKVVQVQEVERRKQLISLDQFVMSESDSETQYIERLVDDKNQELLMGQENRMLVEQAIDQLKPEYQEVVRMTYFKDMSQTEIAEVMGISQMQVSRRLRKALDQLTISLEDARPEGNNFAPKSSEAVSDSKV
ncbi:MAG: sigma-70 family RNA polymerase sigma factor [Vampirovibrio sp.]|nr:sigma-70 family RNA polymerase sigma factor [Vampirovibrio sp.]